ncbi:MAG: PQQ-binding-like beta-propeller repeat protein, partial [Myxococcota bacterium]|nr:PQQ-binding-like beta-propeller repeat protein [Myxococcota bacterium]
IGPDDAGMPSVDLESSAAQPPADAAADVAPPGSAVDAWPQAGGPDGTFRVNVQGAPTKWSVASNQNIVWAQTLPDEGQGGIAVSGNLLFLETFPPFNGTKSSLDVVGYAIDRATGAIQWQTPVLHGNGLPSPMAYSYSDATSWTPVTDGQYVWFFNAAGHMGCWDISGHVVWERDFVGQSSLYPFNRQHEPILIGNSIAILSPLGAGDPAPKQAGWNYLHGIDKMTGKTTWVADDASTFYNTAVMGLLPSGAPAVLHGRGGPHGAAETPVGLSMTSLAPGSEGRSLWQYAGSGTALYTMTWDSKYAYWFTVSPNETMVVLDAATGKPVHTWSLFQNVDVRRWDTTAGAYVSMPGVDIHNTNDWTYGGVGMHVMPNWHTNIVANGYHWFLTSTNNNRTSGAGAHCGPPHSLGRVNVETGKVEYLELPVGVARSPGSPDQLTYGKSLTTTAADSKGNDVALDNRSHTDGWEIPAFFASPILLGNQIYFGTTLGITYVIDASARTLDQSAILGYGDLGALGQTWSLAGPSFAGGVLYHHSSKQVVAIRP